MKQLNVLVLCECSQTVVSAFRELGHNAWSVDIATCYGNHPEWHIQGDAFRSVHSSRDAYYDDERGIRRSAWEFSTQDGFAHYLYKQRFDLIIAFPPCTYLARSGQRHCNEELYGIRAAQRKELRSEAIDFFKKFTRITDSACQHIAIENPLGIMSEIYREPDQIIQPWQFDINDNVQKSTCLWLKNLPPLVPKYEERQLEPDLVHWTGKDGKEKKMERFFYESRFLPEDERRRVRSKTFQGIAKAMAEQWSNYLSNEP